MAKMPKLLPEELDFVAAIRAAPRDDEPRLAYGRWLRARDQPRGELIEVQCTLARLGNVRTPEREELLQRERALLKAHGAEWAARIGLSWKSLPLTRGFVERLQATGRVFARAARTIFDLEPLAQLHLMDAPREALLTISDEERLATLVSLEIEFFDAPEALESLFARDRLGGLRRLGVAFGTFGDRAASGLAASRALAGLEELDLRVSDIGAAGMRALAHSDRLGALRSFAFRGDLSKAMMEALFASPLAKRLTRLALSGGYVLAPGIGVTSERLRDDGGALLARSVSAELAHLTVDSHYIGVSGLEAITSRLSSLRSLDLRLGALGTPELAVLASARMPALVSLGLGQNDLDADGVAVLARATALPRLAEIELSEGTIDGRAIEILGASPLGTTLRSLYLRASRVDGAAVGALARSGMLERLRSLVLDLCPVGEDGARSLADARASALAELRLYECDLGDGGASALARATGLTALDLLDIRKNQIGNEAAVALLEAPSLRWARIDLRDNPVAVGCLSADARRPLPMLS
jgi:uncharacterized protein (TIGR02996 family)